MLCYSIILGATRHIVLSRIHSLGFSMFGKIFRCFVSSNQKYSSSKYTPRFHLCNEEDEEEFDENSKYLTSSFNNQISIVGPDQSHSNNALYKHNSASITDPHNYATNSQVYGSFQTENVHNNLLYSQWFSATKPPPIFFGLQGKQKNPTTSWQKCWVYNVII